MGWLAVGLILASVIVAKSLGKRAGGPMFLSWLGGFLLAFWIAGWWGTGPLAEQAAPTDPPASSQVENQVPEQVGNQVPGLVDNQVPEQVENQVPEQVPAQVPEQVPPAGAVG